MSTLACASALLALTVPNARDGARHGDRGAPNATNGATMTIPSTSEPVKNFFVCPIRLAVRAGPDGGV